MGASHKTSIKFNNLYIPVKMVKVSKDDSIELNQLCKDSKERVKYRKYCSSCNKEITNKDIVKGYCYDADKYVILEQSDMDSIITESDKMINVKYFCKPKEIDNLLIDKSYYLIPELVSEKDYHLLRRAMIASRVVAIAEMVVGTKQELVVLVANKNCIIAKILLYKSEMNETPNISKQKIGKTELSDLKIEISHNVKNFNWEQHHDNFQERLRKLIINKIKEIGSRIYYSPNLF